MLWKVTPKWDVKLNIGCKYVLARVWQWVLGMPGPWERGWQANG